jgi:hypothetical protein
VRDDERAHGNTFAISVAVTQPGRDGFWNTNAARNVPDTIVLPLIATDLPTA